jgi:hypothetical protein
LNQFYGIRTKQQYRRNFTNELKPEHIDTVNAPISDKVQSEVVVKFTTREAKLEELRKIDRPSVNIFYYVGTGLFQFLCAIFILWLGWDSKSAEEGIKQIAVGDLLGLSGLFCVALGIYNQVNSRIKKLTELLIKETESQPL